MKNLKLTGLLQTLTISELKDSVFLSDLLLQLEIKNRSRFFNTLDIIMD
jgi:hypothetical protein